MMRNPLLRNAPNRHVRFPGQAWKMTRLLPVVLLALAASRPASAQTFGERPIRYGITSGPHYDGRGDDRDFPTNGFFPGNFAADPVDASIGGAAGFLESNPRRSPLPYPSQRYVGPRATYCRGFPVYDPRSRDRQGGRIELSSGSTGSGTFNRSDGCVGSWIAIKQGPLNGRR